MIRTSGSTNHKVMNRRCPVLLGPCSSNSETRCWRSLGNAKILSCAVETLPYTPHSSRLLWPQPRISQPMMPHSISEQLEIPHRSGHSHGRWRAGAHASLVDTRSSEAESPTGRRGESRTARGLYSKLDSGTGLRHIMVTQHGEKRHRRRNTSVPLAKKRDNVCKDVKGAANAAHVHATRPLSRMK
jgi:hypothetical protein